MAYQTHKGEKKEMNKLSEAQAISISHGVLSILKELGGFDNFKQIDKEYPGLTDKLIESFITTLDNYDNKEEK